MMSEAEHQEDLSGALLLDEQPGRGVEDEAVEHLIDQDPDVRAAIAAEIKARLMTPPNAAQEAPPEAGVRSRLADIASKIDAAEKWVDGFYERSEADRVGDYSYTAFQRKQDEIRRLEREARALEREELRLMQNLGQSDAWVEQWIGEAKSKDPLVERYAPIIKRLAAQLPAAVLADREKLRSSLLHYIEPNAYKQYNVAQRQGTRRADPRRDTAGSGAYGDERGSEPAREGKDPYADASPQEREFLRRVGLIKEQAGNDDTGLIPDGDGFVIPVRRGRRNEVQG